MPYNINIEPQAFKDVQNAINYYDEQQFGLGEMFEASLNTHLVSLETNPFFQIRYDDVRCLPVKEYPYMIHFTINEPDQTVIIRAVFHTSLNPKKWTGR